MKLFGTDGIRGRAGTFPLTSLGAVKIGMTVGRMLTNHKEKPLVLIGKDTRLSGYLLEYGIVSGLVSVGVDVFLVGPLPTPAVAMLTKALRADVGVMVSASHNHYKDNGFKFFDNKGYKFSAKIERQIEKDFIKFNTNFEEPKTEERNFGRVKRIDDALGRYIEFVKSSFPRDLDLNNVKIILDCANGSAYSVAPKLFWELGAEVIAINNIPNGCNINESCGATFPDSLRHKVMAERANIGLAFDGDADRLVVVDEKGDVLDGDQILAIIAEDRMPIKGKVVTTVMANLGLDKYLKGLNLEIVRSPVGDREVAEAMAKTGAFLGGEPSGHIILGDHNTCSDALATSLQILSFMQKHKLKASNLRRFKSIPQILRNLQITNKDFFEAEVWKIFLDDLLAKNDKDVQLVVRISGTENVLRVMAQSENWSLANNLVEQIVEFIEKNLRC